MNKWSIPDWLEKEVRARDKACVYCQTTFSRSSRKAIVSWEHIINDAKIITRENIVLCCVACNASKGQKSLCEWLKSKYCVDKEINENTVSDVVKAALKSSKRGLGGL